MTAQIAAFVNAASAQSASDTATAWNTLVASLGQIKASRIQQQQGLSLAATPSVASLLGAGGSGLLSDVLSILGGRSVAGAADAAGTAVASTASAVANSALNTVSGVLAGVVALGQAVLSLDPANVLNAANNLADVVVKFLA